MYKMAISTTCASIHSSTAVVWALGRDCSLLQLRQQCSNATTTKKVDDALLQRGGRALACTHVRAANRPAISLYQSLGLKIGELEFPEWFDYWHGGYTLEASCEEIITRVQAKYRGR